MNYKLFSMVEVRFFSDTKHAMIVISKVVDLNTVEEMANNIRKGFTGYKIQLVGETPLQLWSNHPSTIAPVTPLSGNITYTNDTCTSATSIDVDLYKKYLKK